MSLVMLGQDFSYAVAVTPHDTTDNLANAIYIQNTGTAGAVPIRQLAAYGNVTVYLAQGQSMRVGRLWEGVMSTGLGAGVTIVKFQ